MKGYLIALLVAFKKTTVEYFKPILQPRAFLAEIRAFFNKLFK